MLNQLHPGDKVLFSGKRKIGYVISIGEKRRGTSTVEVISDGNITYETPWSLEILEEVPRVRDRINSILLQRDNAKNNIGFKRLNKLISKLDKKKWEELGNKIQDDSKVHSYYDYKTRIKGYEKYHDKYNYIDDDFSEKFLQYKNTNVMKKWEVFSKEYFELFANYLANQIKCIYEKKQKAVTILEVGANLGIFASFLQYFLELELDSNMFNLVLIDNMKHENEVKSYLSVNIQEMFKTEMGIVLEGIKSNYGKSLNVMKYDIFDGLDKIEPDIAYCSWPASGIDVTQPLRDSETLQQYILMGIPSKTGNRYTWANNGLQTRHLEKLERYQDLTYGIGRGTQDIDSKTVVFYTNHQGNKRTSKS